MAGEHVVEVTYCAGWDPEAREPVGATAAEWARERDAAGRPYAVLLATGSRPRALLQVDWGNHYLGLFAFDEHGRRDRCFDYRALAPGLLHLRQYDLWRYGGPDDPERPERGWRFTLTAQPGRDKARAEIEDGGRLFQALHALPAQHRCLRRAKFGDWTAYAHARMLGCPPTAAGGVRLVPARHTPPVSPVSPEGTAPGGAAPRGGTPGGAMPWRAPSGARPRHLLAAFTPGTRFSDRHLGVGAVTEPEHRGTLRVPTGAVIAADPSTLGSDDGPFTVTVPPGRYPVLVAGLRWESEPWDEVTAAMLRTSDEPTVSWELAVRPGQDARLLGEGQFYGFGVDTATGAFLDASGRDALAAAYQGHPVVDEPAAEVVDAESGLNMITYPSGHGDGSYPVWVGRDAAGKVTCLVADMLILSTMDPLPPAVAEPAVFLTPGEAAPDDAPGGAEPAGAEATDGFLADAAARTEAKMHRVRRAHPFPSFA